MTAVSCPSSFQGWSLLLIGPFLDRYVSEKWVFHYSWTSAALVCLAVSCSLAVGVNLSQFACLGRFSAVSFQVPPPPPPPPSTNPAPHPLKLKPNIQVVLRLHSPHPPPPNTHLAFHHDLLRISGGGGGYIKSAFSPTYAPPRSPRPPLESQVEVEI